MVFLEFYVLVIDSEILIIIRFDLIRLNLSSNLIATTLPARPCLWRAHSSLSRRNRRRSRCWQTRIRVVTVAVRSYEGGVHTH